jgi:DedD protein
MLRDDLDEELEAEKPRQDVELTLGPAVLFAFACGLILLCGLCFGVGYTSGRRSGARAASAKEAASGQTLAAQAAAGRKPAAKGTPPAVQAASSSNETSPASGLPSGAASQEATRSSPANPVRPAITSQAGQPQSPLTQNPTPRVQPALPPGSGVMVQIAAVSHVEDANVLMGALRRRGYEVAARREADDNLIHVQIGPFATRAEANAMSQRLLGDGYNAIVLP